MLMDRIALTLTVIGALNWGSVGLFKFDVVAWLFGGQDAVISRIVYTLVALAGIWCISLIFRARENIEEMGHYPSRPAKIMKFLQKKPPKGGFLRLIDACRCVQILI